MASLKPQTLPYTKKGIFDSVTTAGAHGHRRQGRPERQRTVVQPERWHRQQPSQPQPRPDPGGRGQHHGVVVPVAGRRHQHRRRRHLRRDGAGRESQRAQAPARRLARGPRTLSGNDTTLLDDELETLFSRFQKSQTNLAKDDKSGGALARDSWADEEAKAQRLRREEAKVRALNRNGRVDYSIQE